MIRKTMSGPSKPVNEKVPKAKRRPLPGMVVVSGTELLLTDNRALAPNRKGDRHIHAQDALVKYGLTKELILEKLQYDLPVYENTGRGYCKRPEVPVSDIDKLWFYEPAIKFWLKHKCTAWTNPETMAFRLERPTGGDGEAMSGAGPEASVKERA